MKILKNRQSRDKWLHTQACCLLHLMGTMIGNNDSSCEIISRRYCIHYDIIIVGYVPKKRRIWKIKTETMNVFLYYFRTPSSPGRRLTATDEDGCRDIHYFIRIVLSLNSKHGRPPNAESEWMTEPLGCTSVSVRVCVRAHPRICAGVCVCVCVRERGWHLNEANWIDFPRCHRYQRDAKTTVITSRLVAAINGEKRLYYILLYYNNGIVLNANDFDIYNRQ